MEKRHFWDNVSVRIALSGAQQKSDQGVAFTFSPNEAVWAGAEAERNPAGQKFLLLLLLLSSVLRRGALLLTVARWLPHFQNLPYIPGRNKGKRKMKLFLACAG